NSTSSKALLSVNQTTPLHTSKCVIILLPRHPTSPLFPYTTLFRSLRRPAGELRHRQPGNGIERRPGDQREQPPLRHHHPVGQRGDRKSTRLNSSHLGISYAVFCLKKKNTRSNQTRARHTHERYILK